MLNGSNKPLEITAMKPSDVVAVLSNAYRRKITEEQVLEVAHAGNMLSGAGRINLIEYTAFLAGEVSASGN